VLGKSFNEVIMETVKAKRGPIPSVDYENIDTDGTWVSAKTKRKVYNVRHAAYNWATRNNVKFSCSIRNDKKGKLAGVMIYLVED
jgi:hypothetical protein